MLTQTLEGTTIELLTGYLPRYGWPGFTVMEDTPEGGRILTGWHSQFVDQSRVMFLTLDHRQRALTAVVPALMSAPQEQMAIGQLADVLMALGFANYALPMGAFAYDPADGEIRFELGLPVDGATVTFDQFAHILNTCQAAVTYWAPRLKDVADGSRTGASVVASFRGHVAEFAGMQ